MVWLSKREKGLPVQTNDAVHYCTVNTIPKDIPSVALLPGLGESIRLLLYCTYVVLSRSKPSSLIHLYYKCKVRQQPQGFFVSVQANPFLSYLRGSKIK